MTIFLMKFQKFSQVLPSVYEKNTAYFFQKYFFNAEFSYDMSMVG
jgi:hypothetical protein